MKCHFLPKRALSLNLGRDGNEYPSTLPAVPVTNVMCDMLLYMFSYHSAVSCFCIDIHEMNVNVNLL